MVKEQLAEMFDGGVAAGVLIVSVVFVVALIGTRLARLVTRRVIRRIALAGITGSQSGYWRVRAMRTSGETGDTYEQRRRQRIDAASRMVGHLVSVVIWIAATIVTFHLLDINPAFFLSSAGFLGAALAIGGQHKVNDYLTGLSVLFEDRYGVGDEILVRAPGWDEPVHGVVDHVGLFSTRVRDDRSTLHFPNSALGSVRNLSQEAALSMIRVRVPEDADAADAAATLRGLAGTDGLTDVVFVGDLATTSPSTGEIEVEVRTARPLDDRSRSRLAHRAERALYSR